MYFFKWLNRVNPGNVLMLCLIVGGLLASCWIIVSFNTCGARPSKAGKMKQLAIDLGRGQESFRSRHGRYYPITTTPEVYTPALKARWSNLLEFNPGAGAQSMQITVCAGDRGEQPASPLCAQARPDTTRRWFAIVVQDDHDGDGTREATVVFSNNGAEPKGWRTLPL